MSVPSHDLNNIVDFLMKKEDDFNPGLLNDDWPPTTDDFMDIFSLDTGAFNLLDSTSADLGVYVDPTSEKPCSPPGSGSSDSGLSSDHQADVDVFDQQLSPFLGNNPYDEDRTSTTSSPSSPSSYINVAEVSPLATSQQYDHTIEVQEAPDDIDVVGLTNADLNESHLFKSAQLGNNRKRKPSLVAVGASVAQPKIQKSTIVKPLIRSQKAMPITVSSVVPTNVVKPKIVVSAAPTFLTQQPKGGTVQIARQPISFQASDAANKQRKVIRVAPMTGNARSILLPVTIKDMKDLRSIKIINASDLKNTANIKIAAANLLQQTKASGSFNIAKPTNNRIKVEIDHDMHNSYVMDDSNSDGSDDEDASDSGSPRYGKNQQYPRLILSAEERKLLAKEGITLPTSYPLTKHEERELKRIRRKIRNKISAQDSRKRKKEYVDGLEDRVKQCSTENQTLMKRIKVLQTQNHLLASHLKKLQNALTKSTSKSTQPATCLLVLLLSMALVAVPSLRPSPPDDLIAPAGGESVAESDAAAAIRRVLLSAQAPANSVEGVATEEFITVDDYASEELVLPYEQSTLISDHDYPMVKPKHSPALLPGGYLDIPLDEEWPPNKKIKRGDRPVFDLDDGSDNLPYILKDPKNDKYPMKDLSIDELLAGNERLISVGGKLGGTIDLGSSGINLPGHMDKCNDTKPKMRSVVLANGI